jgi:hypothetical protein
LGTVRSTGIVVIIVAVITLLYTCIEDTVSATSDSTMSTSVLLIIIAIIALFTGLSSTISADLHVALTVTAITVDSVTIITLFNAAVEDPIPTDSDLTVIGAGVMVIKIPIITLLIPCDPDSFVPTSSVGADLGTVLGRSVVRSLIALFVIRRSWREI